MSGDKPTGNDKVAVKKPRKVYKKIYRLKGEKMNGEPIKELSAADAKNRRFLLQYGRLCNALKMEGKAKPKLEVAKDDNDKKIYSYKLIRDHGNYKIMTSQ